MKKYPNRVTRESSTANQKPQIQSKTGQGTAGEKTLKLRLSSDQHALLMSAVNKQASGSESPAEPNQFAISAIVTESLRTLGQTADPMGDLEDSIAQAVSLISLLAERLASLDDGHKGVRGLAEFTCELLREDFDQARAWLARRSCS